MAVRLFTWLNAQRAKAKADAVLNQGRDLPEAWRQWAQPESTNVDEEKEKEPRHSVKTAGLTLNSVCQHLKV